jgi:hypothetical protein
MRVWALAAPLLLLAFAASASPSPSPYRLAKMRWNGSTTSPAYRATLEEQGQREVQVHPATRSDPVGHRTSLAFYKLAAALGSRLVPRTEARAIALSDFVQWVAADRAGLAPVRDRLRILNDGTLTALVVDAVPEGRVIDWNSSNEVHAFRAWVEGRANVPERGRILAAAYLEAIVLDYLAGNLDRRTAMMGPGDPPLYLLENATAFPDHPDHGGLDIRLEQLKQVTRFPRGFYARLRAFDRAAAEVALHEGPFASWLVSARPLVLMMERRRAVLSLVEARAAEIGEDNALSLP